MKNPRVFSGWCVATMLALTACDTPATRARCHPVGFRKLSAEDRRLALSGKVHAGMDRVAVYIAWGEPDAKQKSDEGKDASETWTYRRTLTLKSPMDSFDRWLPGNSVLGGAAPFGLRSGAGFGGVGNEGMTLFQPHLLVADDTIKRALFEDGKLTRYEEGQAGTAAAR